MSEISPALRRQLLQFFEKKYTLDDLKTLCFDLGVDYTSLRDRSVSDLSTDLWQYCLQSNKTNLLLREIMLDRPTESDFLKKYLSKIPASNERRLVAVKYEVNKTNLSEEQVTVLRNTLADL